MKSWNEIKNGMIVYIKDPIEIYDDDQIIGSTKPYQKAYVENCDGEEVVVIIDDGEFDGFDLWWYIKRDNPEELLTEEEYSLLDITEKKIWFELQKYLKKIDTIKEKSDDIIKIKGLIKKNST